MINFYQSTLSVSTLYDVSNPDHVKLYNLLMSTNTPTKAQRREANKLMKLIGMQPGLANDFVPVIRWSCDIYIYQRDPATNLIVNRLFDGWQF